jgi:hypothetical protein
MNKNTKTKMTKSEFHGWVHDMVNSYSNRKEQYISMSRCGMRTYIFNAKTMKSTVSSCNTKEDDFSYMTGTAIAWARYKGWIVPEVIDNE